jgi:hypothetical protein
LAGYGKKDASEIATLTPLPEAQTLAKNRDFCDNPAAERRADFSPIQERE